ncbi:MAG: porin [Cyanobium sp. CACIAM 14]|nr:MAG: porin [Cyanobium sp. CACIAM 14]
MRSSPTARALLLLAVLAPAAALAGEPDLDAIRRYATPAAGKEQVTSLSQFSDIKPTDWAYQALTGLVERYGCVAGYPNGSFAGSQAMTRYEAAALLNACLDRITEVTDELRRLMAEFEKELAVLRGRVDGLEARVGELEATRFSTTTKLKGKATFVVGANAFGGSDGANVALARATVGATTFNYDLQLNLDTSFSSKDLLRTVLRGANFARSAFGGAGPTGSLSTLDIAFEEPAGPNVVGIDRLFYQFPIGGSFTATLGGRVEQDDLLAIVPSVYPADSILNLFTLNGAPGAYNKTLGSGGALWWKQDGWAVSAAYVAQNGNIGNPALGGIATNASAATGSVQIGYAKEQWALAAIYSYVQSGVAVPDTTPLAGVAFTNPASRTNAFGISGYWQPASAGWLPSISVGWGINSTRYSVAQATGTTPSTSQSWQVGLQWSDLFVKGNQLGLAVGQPVFTTGLNGGGTPADGNFVWEGWYKVQVSDHITVTPAFFYLSRPLGQSTTPGTSFHQLGGLIKTSFNF